MKFQISDCNSKKNYVIVENSSKRNMRYIKNCLIALLCLSFIIGLTACLEETEVDEAKPADYGSFGYDVAVELATKWPNRSPGSVQEKQAAEYIAETFQSLGYDPEVMPFTYVDDNGDIQSSQNVIVRIKGDGFTVADDRGTHKQVEMQAIIGAHYDVAVTKEQSQAAEDETSETTQETEEVIDDENEDEEEEETQEDTLYTEVELPMPTLAEFDGIHNNASGVGSLLTIARQIKSQSTRYDIVLIAFGAGNAGQAGSRAYAAEMSDEEIANTDVMYNIDGIYAGDKVYAHSGQNSVAGTNQKIYEKRRKLYQATDVYYENELYTNNQFALYTNQSGIEVPWGEDGTGTATYREWTFRESDHSPFDKLNISVVFFESYDYDASNLDNMKESSNPAFAATNGFISNTAFDSSKYLENLFALNQTDTSTLSENESADTDLLTRRINNVSFVIEQAIHKGLHNAVEE